MLNIITACIRPQNLQKIYESIVASLDLYGKPVDIHWHIILDGLYKDESLKLLIETKTLPFTPNFPVHLHVNDTFQDKWDSPINVGLSKIEKGLVTIIDDDNIMHHDFIRGVYPAYLAGKKGFLFHQQLSVAKNCNNIVRYAKIANIKPGKMDTAQFCFDRSIIDIRWDWYSPQPDGAFMRSIFLRNQQDIQIIDDILCHYNFLSTKPNAFNR